MALKICAAGFCAAVLAALALASAPAEAAAKKRVVAKPVPLSMREVLPRQVAANRARTRITVQPRSFLDAGTGVVPGERKFNDYAFPPYYSPTSIIDNKGPFHRSPLPGPFELPGYSPW